MKQYKTGDLVVIHTDNEFGDKLGSISKIKDIRSSLAIMESSMQHNFKYLRPATDIEIDAFNSGIKNIALIKNKQLTYSIY